MSKPTALDLKRPYTYLFDRYWRIEWGTVGTWASLSYKPGKPKPYRLSLNTPEGAQGFACVNPYVINVKLRTFFDDDDFDIHGSYKLKDMGEPSD